jgi:hypothetical protein
MCVQGAAELLQHVPLLSGLPGHALSMLSYLNRSHFRAASSS